MVWWLRSGCFPNCGRRATHMPFASPAERTRLLSFCRELLLAAPAGSSGSVRLAGQDDPAAPPGASAVSPWLRMAPPWALATQRKRQADEISVAEATLGKLAARTAVVTVDRFG